MFRSESIPVQKLQSVAAELTGWFTPVMEQKMGAASKVSTGGSSQVIAESESKSAMAENTEKPAEPDFMLDETSFAIYMLEEDKIAEAIKSGKSLVDLDIRNTRRCHHQITKAGVPTGYARTEADDSGTINVCQLFVSDLARAFDSAITWLTDYEETNPDYVKTDPLVRVLVVPAYHVHAFWILHEVSGRSDVVVIDAPPEMRGLEGEHLLSSDEFLKAFEGVSPKAGLTFDDDLTRRRSRLRKKA